MLYTRDRDIKRNIMMIGIKYADFLTQPLDHCHGIDDGGIIYDDVVEIAVLDGQHCVITIDHELGELNIVATKHPGRFRI